MSIIFAAPIEQFPINHALSSVPVASSTSSGFPASNLITRDPTQVFKAGAGQNELTITWDFGAEKTFNLVSFINTNLSVMAYYSMEVSDNGTAWVTVFTNKPFWANLSSVVIVNPPYTEALDPRFGSVERPVSFFYTPTDIYRRFVRFTLTDPLVSSFTIGRLFIGRQWRPASRYQYGSGFEFADTGTFDRTDQGASVIMDGRTIVTANVKMSFISTKEMYDVVYEFNYWRKSTREILCCLDVDTLEYMQKNIIYGRIAEGRSVVAEYFNAWSQTWKIESF